MIEAPPTPPTAAELFGQGLRYRRTTLGLGQGEVASLAYLNRSLISKLEGGRKPPTETTAAALDRVLEAGGALVEAAEAARAQPYSFLPQQPPYFMGRDRVLDQLSDKLLPIGGAADTTTRVVCLSGEPGVGKTALALKWAHDRLVEGFIVVFAKLRGFSADDPATPQEILEDLLLGLSVTPDRIPAAESERRAMFHTVLAHRGKTLGQRILVVLDNARNYQQVASLLTGAPPASFLITSRLQLSRLVVEAGAAKVMLDGLDEESSAELAARLIGRERAVAEPEAMTRLVGLCAHLPLALTIAAERVHAQPFMTIREHADELQQAAHRLDRLEIPDDDTTGVRAAFSWSYTALPPQQAQLFRALGTFAGLRFGAQDAAELIGVSQDEAALLLEDLAQVHLVQPVASRREPNSPKYFGLHDLLRSYAAEEARAHALASALEDAGQTGPREGR